MTDYDDEELAVEYQDDTTQCPDCDGSGEQWDGFDNVFRCCTRCYGIGVVGWEGDGGGEAS